MRLLIMTLCTTTLCSAALLSCTRPGHEEQIEEPPERQERAFYLGGIQVNEAENPAWFDNLERQGMNTIQVTDYAMQGDWDSDELSWDEEKPHLLSEIRGAKERGLSVVLVLRVALDPAPERNNFLWHGMIMPKSEAQLDSWFEKYRRFCLRWAKVAEQEGVDILVLGSELNALASTERARGVPALEEYYLNEEKQDRRRREVLDQRELIERGERSMGDEPSVEEYLDARIATEQAWARAMLGGDGDASTLNERRAALQEHWLELIDALRSVYSGPLGYAANFDQYQDVGFWPQLDVIGINAYFKLRNQILEDFDEAALLPLLLEGWRTALGDIAAFRKARGLEDLPVIFTELGYTWRRRSTLEPWADTGFAVIEEPPGQPGGESIKRVVVWRDEPKQPAERALAVRALAEAHGELETPFLRGILYWKLSSHAYHEDDEAFMLHIGEDSEDPALAELRRFVETAG